MGDGGEGLSPVKDCKKGRWKKEQVEQGVKEDRKRREVGLMTSRLKWRGSRVVNHRTQRSGALPTGAVPIEGAQRRKLRRRGEGDRFGLAK